MKTRIISLLLALILCAAALVSCGGSDDKANGGKEENVKTETKAPVDRDPEAAKIEEYVDDLAGSVNYDGMTFNYLVYEASNDNPTEEEITGELLSDSVYMRQVALEEKFGIDFVNVPGKNGEEVQNMVTREVMSGGSGYDLVHGWMTTVGQPLMLNGAIMSVNDFSVLDISHDWWLKSLEERYTICGKLYFLSGPIITAHYTDGTCMLFNKTVAENYHMPNLYQIVDDGDWTIDKMFEVASVIPPNLDGSGTYRYISGGDTGIDLFYSSGFRLVETDENGELFMQDTLPKDLSDFADKMSKVLGDDTQTVMLKSIKGTSETAEGKYGVSDLFTLFENNQVFLSFDSMGGVASAREYDVDFGVIPAPKRNELQKDYLASGNGAGWAVYIPKTIRDREFADVIIESMAALSKEYMQPAYIEKMLKGRSAEDVESRRMIDIIFAARVNDLVDIFSGGDMNTAGDLPNLIDDSIKLDSTGFASSYRALAKLTNRKIDQMMKQVDRDS
ncbi:MAG: hypothetical protein MJ096_01890 [Clostridia bacterium]|nr:hypothetical protein [Clostridia bacterium]